MSARVGRVRSGSKSAYCRNRQSKRRMRQSISPVMQKVKALLPASKAASHLHILTDAPLSTCEKLLCGQRGESAEMLTALLRSSIGRDVLFALMGDAAPEWFVRYRKQLDVNDARRQVNKALRAIETLQREACE